MRTQDNQIEMRKRVGQYSYESKDAIGKGYSSVVYRGVNDSSGQSIAIKLIDMKNIKGDVHKALLNNQIQILRLLNNLQNVIKLYDILPLKGHTCIVTQLCDGGDLAKTIKTRKFIPEKEAIQILKEIVNGYKGINRFGIIHRDLKPANIFFNQGKVKIADFGFAIKSEDLKRGSNYNVGSPVYMPLQALNDNMYSTKSDIWAIGIIFYQMLTGHTPWKAKTQVELKRLIKAIPIKSLVPTNISRKSSDFLIKSIQVNPTLRMSPQQMYDFFDHHDEDTQRSTVSINQRTNYLFKTRAMSQDREERNDCNLPNAKNTVTAPKPFRKISNLGDTNYVQKLPEVTNGFQKLIQGKSQRKENTKLTNLARTMAGIGGDLPTEWIPDHNKTSAHLLSQIHFCRFFYKLLQRMDVLRKQNAKLSKLMGQMIMGKFKEVKELKYVNSRYAAIFRRTKQFQKISQIVEQYIVKYQRTIAQAQLDIESAQKEIQYESNIQILNIYQSLVGEKSIEGHQQQIILLDYLITMKQLLAINASHDLEYFHNKSKIETIVQGRPAKNITAEHFQAIVHKLKLFKII